MFKKYVQLGHFEAVGPSDGTGVHLLCCMGWTEGETLYAVEKGNLQGVLGKCSLGKFGQWYN